MPKVMAKDATFWVNLTRAASENQESRADQTLRLQTPSQILVMVRQWHGRWRCAN